MAPKWVFLFTIVGFCNNVRRTKAVDVKTWRVDTNFDNPRNWEEGRLPCSNDRVIFPESSSVLVFMPDTMSVAEMVLPLNGELVFPSNGIFNITGRNPSESCVGKDAKFKANADFWYDPNNWNITSVRAFPRLSSRRNAAVPHAYQVPCATDIVQFPASSSFRVQAINPTTSVAFLHINNVQYSQAEFDSLLSTSTGKLLFPDNPKLQITHSTCTDETGCICGNEESSILNLVCKFVNPCPAVDCYDHIEVVGHCCPICAAKLVVKPDDNFRMEQLLQLHQSFHSKVDFSRVESFSSKTTSGDIQSIFVDDTGVNKIANELAQQIYKTLTEDAAGSRLYRIRSIEIYKSTQWNSGASGSDAYTSGISSGGTATIIILVLLFVGFAAAFYFYKKRQIPGFSFARFDLRSDRIELELGTTPHDELEPGENTEPQPSVQEEKSKGFDNPIYGTSVTSETSSIIEDLPENKNFVENPMFGTFVDSKGEDS